MKAVKKHHQAPEITHESKGQKTARRILEAAATCIATLGVERSSITEIAKRAEVSRALVAHHFPRKAGIFHEVILHIAGEGYRSIEAFRPEWRALDRIRHILSSNFDFFFREDQYFKCFLLFYYYASFDPEYRKLNTTLNSRAVQRFAELLRLHFSENAEDPDEARIIEAANEIHHGVIGTIHNYYTVKTSLSVREYKERGLKTLMLLVENALAMCRKDPGRNPTTVTAPGRNPA